MVEHDNHIPFTDKDIPAHIASFSRALMGEAVVVIDEALPPDVEESFPQQEVA